MINPYGQTYAPRTVGRNELVKNQMSGLMNQGGKYLSDARTRGANETSRRGLLNSSLGAAGAESSAIQAALPIASQDASTYRSAADMQSGNEQQAHIVGAQIASNDRQAQASMNASASASAAAAADRQAERDWLERNAERNRGWAVEDRNFGRTASVEDRDVGYSQANADREANFGYGREGRDFQRERENAGFANEQQARNDSLFRDFMMPFLQGAGSSPDFWANPEALGGFIDFLSSTNRRAVRNP